MKYKSYLLMTILAATSLFGCQAQSVNQESEAAQPNIEGLVFSETTEQKEPALADGLYGAFEEEFSAQDGWKDFLSFEIKDGSIISVNINAINEKATLTKKVSSTNGTYIMNSDQETSKLWHEQIDQIEKYLISNQNFEQISLDDQGKTDAISGVSISIQDYLPLFEEAIKNGPIERGLYQDGHYYAESDAFDSGYKYCIDLNVVNGYIVSAYWNGISEDGTATKKEKSINGDYGMVAKGNAQSEWHEQAKLMESYLISIQDPTLITYTEDNKTDAIASVSISINDFVELSIKALANGPTIE